MYDDTKSVDANDRTCARVRRPHTKSVREQRTNEIIVVVGTFSQAIEEQRKSKSLTKHVIDIVVEISAGARYRREFPVDVCPRLFSAVVRLTRFIYIGRNTCKIRNLETLRQETRVCFYVLRK